MTFTSHFLFYLACLLTWTSNAHALQPEPVPSNPPDLDNLSSLYETDDGIRQGHPFTTAIGNLHDLQQFIESPNLESESDNDIIETVFIFIDTAPLLSSAESSSLSDAADQDSVKKFDPEFHSTIVRHLNSTYHEFAHSRQDEPSLRFGAVSISPPSLPNKEKEKEKGEMIRDMFRHLGVERTELEAGLAALLCLNCNGIPSKTETWVFNHEYTIQEAKEALEAGAAEFSAGAGGGDDDKVEKWKKASGTEQNQWRMVAKGRESEMEKWMASMARPVIGELTEANLGRVREIENTTPTVYVLTSSPSQRSHLRRTLFSLAVKYHSWLQIVLVDPVLFPDLAKELGLDFPSSPSNGKDDVQAAVVWPQKPNTNNHDSRTNPDTKKLIYHYPRDKPITESSIKQWGLDLYLGRVRPWVPPSTDGNEEGNHRGGKGNGNVREEVLRVLKERVHVVKGGKKATRKVVKRSGNGKGKGKGAGRAGRGLEGVKIRVAGRDEL
ncbi:hypothetical protein B0T20DRAFT_422093 [Sordaria brevicollis]|uniref:Uncharacterized protein n=1 Tax=Sordaria brevicollis TaxID=83679 RepID=A0AAE0U5V3_SORBR|nr:hypothetical protein B0T20DRAFT_422093 [Sordaria brevicollis]